MSKRFFKLDPMTDYSVSKAEDKFAQYLRRFYRVSVPGSPANHMTYWEFEPRHSRKIRKSRDVDIVLEDYGLPIELLGPPHRKPRQEKKDKRIWKEIEKQYGRKPVLIEYDGKEPSLKKMREWHEQIKERTGE